MKYEIGHKYVVHNDKAREYQEKHGWGRRGSYLSGWRTHSQGGGAYYQTGYRHDLPDGAVIIYSGTEYSGGCDGISVHGFDYIDPETGERIHGVFQPESWGCIPEGVLTPMEKQQ